MRTVLVTGGCGFVGTNLVLDRRARGDRVRVLDNCARPGSERNRAVLEEIPGVEMIDGDVRDAEAVFNAVAGADAVFHLAAQVAVTSSVVEPRHDFDVNALGTLNVLEAARQGSQAPLVIYSSTNKVYGALGAFEVHREEGRYRLAQAPLGIPETAPLDFHSPYGCSKGAADQYVIDYGRIYGISTVTFRQSCIYGPWQHGNEDQGWVAHFARRALDGEGVTIYGDGRQVRDLLYVNDLIELYHRTLEQPEKVAGRAYNIGGGPDFSLAVGECVEELEKLLRRTVPVVYGDWRPGDQRVYVSDVTRIGADLGWAPRTPPQSGIEKLVDWLMLDEAAQRQAAIAI